MRKTLTAAILAAALLTLAACGGEVDGELPDATAMAEDIETAQAEEIQTMQGLLES